MFHVNLATTAVLAANILAPYNLNSVTDTNSYIGNQAHYTTAEASLPEANSAVDRSYLVDENSSLKAFTELRKELISYLNLQENWDGYEGKTPARGAVVAAIDFSYRLFSEGMRLPKPMLSGDGEVGLYIDDGNIFVDIGFENATHFSYYAESADGSSLGEDDLEIATQLPDPLQHLLRNTSASGSITRSAA